jgi:BirA family transcriptional regulator, biotin operon repressor / biotin---[acetyl-CoA-carboxylase] ligase
MSQESDINSDAKSDNAAGRDSGGSTNSMTKIELPVFFWALNWSREKKFPTWSMAEMDSTNTAAKEWKFGALPPPVLFLAEKQTLGRGRGENKWISTEGALLSSWVFEMAFSPQPVLSPMTGLALFNALRKTWPNIAFRLKAPNDIYIGEKKVAGILIETVSQARPMISKRQPR